MEAAWSSKHWCPNPEDLHESLKTHILSHVYQSCYLNNVMQLHGLQICTLMFQSEHIFTGWWMYLE